MKHLLVSGALLGLALLSPAALAQVNVTVGHFAPFATTVAGTAVDIRVNGQVALSGVTFGQFTNPVNLGPAGSYKIDVSPAGSMTVAITATLNLAAGDFSVYALGDGTNQPLSLKALSDDNAAPNPGNVKLRVVHGAPFGNSAANTAVSVRNEQNQIVNSLGSVSFGDASGYFQIPAGRVDLKISTPDGATTLIDPRPATLGAGQIITLVAVGGANTLPLGVTAVANGAAPSNPLPLFSIGPVRTRVAHFAPFNRDVAATAVNVAVNGTQVLTGVRYGAVTDLLNLSGQGSYRIAITPVGAAAPAIDKQIDLDGNRDHIIAAVGNGLTQPLDLLATSEDPMPPAGQNYRLRVVHAAPFAASLDGTRVSIRTDGGDVVAGLSSVPFGAASGFLTLPVGALDIKVATPDGARNLIDPAAVNVPAGATVTAFAIGDGINQPLGIFAVPVGLLPLERAVDLSANGHWFDPRTSGQGLSVIPQPSQNRLIATWYTFGPDGGLRWYLLDSCRTPVGQTACTQPGGFNNERAVMTIYESTGGRLNQADPTTLRDVGSFTINFASCRTGSAEFAFNGGPSGTMNLSNLVPNPDCPAP